MTESFSRFLKAIDNAQIERDSLIDAAPQMFNVLKMMVHACTTPTNGITRAPSWDMIEIAVKTLLKAEGK